jgi:drug/metabolite transporter (DMT)-like permease
MQNNSKRAGMVAAGTAAYLILACVQIFVQLPLGAFAYLLYPAIWALLAPAPFLSLFHLADRNWLVGMWPNAGGFLVLLVVYTCIAYYVARHIGGSAEKR